MPIKGTWTKGGCTYTINGWVGRPFFLSFLIVILFLLQVTILKNAEEESLKQNASNDLSFNYTDGA